MFFFVIYIGCNKEQELGIDVLPSDDLIESTISDTFFIEVHTTKSEHLISSSSSTLLLGSYIDPVFGTIKAGFAAQVLQATYPEFPDLAQFEEIKLYFPLKQDSLVSDAYAYGNFNDNQIVSVYRLSKFLNSDSIYYSDEDMSEFHEGELIGQQEISSTTDTLIITLFSEFGQELFENDEAYFESFEKFHEIFQGIYLTIEDENMQDAAIYKIDLTSSDIRMQLNYTENNSSKIIPYVLPLSPYGARFNVVEFDYTSSEFYDQITNPFTIEDELAYIQAMGGTKVRLRFPTLESLGDSGNIIINKAELIIKTDENRTDLAATNSLTLVGYTEEENVVLFDDLFDPNTGTYLGAYLEENKGEYRINTTRMAQGIIDKESQDFEFYLIDKEATFNFHNTVITTGNHTDRMKLVVTYSKY